MVNFIVNYAICYSKFLPVYAEENVENKPIQIYVNDVQIELSTEPISKNGTTLIPLRSLLESLNMNVQWNSEEQKSIFIKTI